MSEVLILGQIKEGSLDLRTLELLGAGKKIAAEMKGELSILLAGENVSAAANEALKYGPARVYKMEHPLIK